MLGGVIFCFATICPHGHSRNQNDTFVFVRYCSIHVSCLTESTILQLLRTFLPADAHCCAHIAAQFTQPSRCNCHLSPKVERLRNTSTKLCAQRQISKLNSVRISIVCSDPFTWQTCQYTCRYNVFYFVAGWADESPIHAMMYRNFCLSAAGQKWPEHDPLRVRIALYGCFFLLSVMCRDTGISHQQFAVQVIVDESLPSLRTFGSNYHRSEEKTIPQLLKY